ncbi:hypothetical protein ENHY17A_190003 [Moraxellaceae bacterium 17A]|nr:hypothetical protein ENHY17A_190003 [Moraxellaceae bacterium 17A]
MRYYADKRSLSIGSYSASLTLKNVSISDKVLIKFIDIQPEFPRYAY